MLKKKETYIFSVILFLFILIQFRMSALLLTLIFLLLLIPKIKKKTLEKLFIIYLVLLFIFLFSPVDIDIGIYPGHLSGESQKGLRLVRYVCGNPSHTALVKKYQEYFHADFISAGGFEPIWVLTIRQKRKKRTNGSR